MEHFHVITNAETGERTEVPFSQEEIDAYLLANAPKIPKVVTMRQARLALLQAGLLSNIQAAIDSLASPAKEAAQIEWEYSQEVHRDKALVQMLAPVLNLSNAELDNLFLNASTL